MPLSSNSERLVERLARNDGHAADVPRILVIDDDSSILTVVDRFATQSGFAVIRHSNARTALDGLASAQPDVALVDLCMPEIGGLDVLRAIRAATSTCQVILMTGRPTVDTAVEAVKAGALDYLAKPLDFDRLRELLTTVRKNIERRERLLQADAALAATFEFHGMVGRSPAMQGLFDAIRRFARHARTVLITGETGTGKELVARALHQLGPRRDQKLLMVNCSAVVETLFESELFGHQRGAFTGASETKVGLFEHAHNGTLFLDEVGELPLTLQPKLLRTLDHGEIQRVGSLETRTADVHVIAATNRDLRAEAMAGRFRSDLFYRLGIIEVHVAPLRERREDIPYLTAAFIRDCARRLNRQFTGVSLAAERVLQQAPWPGNVRELRNVIEKACILGDGRMLSERDILRAMPVPTAAQIESAGEDGALLSTAQGEHIRRVLGQAGGNKALAARLLGVSRRSLYRWLARIEPLVN